MKVFLLLNTLMVFCFSSFQADVGQAQKIQPSTQDTTLAMLMNQSNHQEISIRIHASLRHKTKMVLMHDQKTYPMTDENLAKLLLNNPKAALRIIKDADSIKKMLPNHPSIGAILLVGQKQ